MSRILWKGFLVSPAVLAASLLVSYTALAAEPPVEISVATKANHLQLADSVTEAVKPEPDAVKAEPVSLASNSTIETIETIETPRMKHEFSTSDLLPAIDTCDRLFADYIEN